MSMPIARDLMTDRVLPAQADWTLQRLAQFLTEHSISGAPVVSEYGGVIGVVSLTDLARHDSKPDTGAEETEEPPAYYLGDREAPPSEEGLNVLEQNPQTTVRDIMMPAVFTVEENAPIDEIADRMVRGKLHRLFVVQEGTKRDIAGIISAIDLLDWVRKQGG